MIEKKKEEVRGTFEFLKDWGDALTRQTERWIPDALVIVIGLSIVAYILALIGDSSQKLVSVPEPTYRFRHGEKGSGNSSRLPCRCVSS